MRSFRVRNLSVAIDSPQQQFPGGCGVITECGVITNCPYFSCGPIYSTPPPFRNTDDLLAQVDMATNPTQRAEITSMLKADLQQALEKLESQEQTIQRQAEPQTREEAEALESQLQEALNEVSTIKRRLNEGGQ